MSKIEAYRCDRCKKVIAEPEQAYILGISAINMSTGDWEKEYVLEADLCKDCMEEITAAVYKEKKPEDPHKYEVGQDLPDDKKNKAEYDTSNGQQDNIQDSTPADSKKPVGGGTVARKTKKWTKIDYEQIDNLYKTTSLTAAQVARKCGCSDASVYNRFNKLIRQNIERRTGEDTVKNYHKGTCKSCVYWHKQAKYCDYTTATGKVRMESVDNCTHWRKK